MLFYLIQLQTTEKRFGGYGSLLVHRVFSGCGLRYFLNQWLLFLYPRIVGLLRSIMWYLIWRRYDSDSFVVCPFPILDDWITSSIQFITSASWGRNDWRRPACFGTLLDQHAVSSLFELAMLVDAVSGFVKETAFCFHGLGSEADPASKVRGCDFSNIW